MDINPENNLGETSQSSTFGEKYDEINVMVTCSLCQRGILAEDDTGDIEGISICGDCRFSLQECLDATSLDVYSRRTLTSRRTRHGSSESMESMFSQQFSQMINMARQSQSMSFEHNNQLVDGNDAARFVQRSTSSRTTPSGSRRWGRAVSDAESDGFDSLYGETESNVSIRRYRYRLFHSEADTMSYSARGGDSDASVDGQSFFENENLDHSNGGSDLETDTDIDPMNVGLYQWNSEDDEEDGEVEDVSEWEVLNTEAVESLRAGGQFYGPLRSYRSNIPMNWRMQSLSPEVEDTFPGERILAHTADLLTNFEESEAQNFVAESGDYLDARGLEILLGNLAETENSRRGAPPASASFVQKLPYITIKEDHDKQDSLACAVCKDSLTIGDVVNQLPCFHLYHPTCILPWLNARNTCPLCRYELPTDDKDYEERKRSRGRSGGRGYESLHVDLLNVNGDGSLDATHAEVVNELSDLRLGQEESELVDADSVTENGARENPRNRWFFLAAAAAPIVSLVGVSLMLWLGKPSADRRWPSGRISNRRENGQRRWWSFI